MKKVAYFLTMILAVALMSTSCDPDPIVPDEELSESLIKNNEWVSVSYNGHGTSCDDGIFTDIMLSKENTEGYDFRILDKCPDFDESYPVNIELYEDEGITKLFLGGNSYFEFNVLNFESDGITRTLTLLLVDTGVPDVSSDGTYILESL